MADTDIIVSEMTPASQINTTDLMIMTQPDSQAETGYSTKSGTVLQVANKMLRGTEYSTDLPDFTDKTPLGGLEELKADIKALLPVDSASGNPCNFETNLADTLVSLIANITASGGNGTPSTPIPIVGHSELNLVRCGINQWDEQWELGSYDNDGQPTPSNLIIRNKNFIKVPIGESIYITTPTNGIIFWYDSAKNFISKEDFYTAGAKSVPNNAVWANFRMAGGYGTVYNNDISFNLPDTNTSYVAFNGQTYSIAFGQTVYGGVYDANAGKVTDTFTAIDLGSLEWTMFNDIMNALVPVTPKQNIYTLQPNEINAVGYQFSPSAYGTKANDKVFCFNEGRLWIYDSSFTDPATFKATMSGSYMAYEKAISTEIDVSELSVDTIVGVNNIVSDCGGDVEVEYRDSIQHYIDKKIAETQALIL